jgi:hypothetical protein
LPKCTFFLRKSVRTFSTNEGHRAQIMQAAKVFEAP